MGELRSSEPLCVAEDPDAVVGGLDVTLDQYYQAGAADGGDVPPDLGETLLTIFRGDPYRFVEAATARNEAYPRAGAAHWPPTYIGGRVGFPSVARKPRYARISEQADRLNLSYPENHEAAAVVALTAFITAFAAEPG